MKIYCAGLITETNTFSSVPCDMATFQQGSLVRNGAFGAMPHPYAQPLLVADRYFSAKGHVVAHGVFAYARPAGPVDHDTYLALREEILDGVRREKPDIVVLVLHGAMATTVEDDCEGDILEAVRQSAGPRCAIGAILDPHCHLSARMVENATTLIFLKEYPHVDFGERAGELCAILERAAAGEVAPVPAVVDCRMIDLFFTSEPASREIVDLCQSLERSEKGILSVSLVHGFPWGDCTDMGTKALAYSDGDPAAALVAAQVLAGKTVAARGRTHPEFLTIAETFARLGTARAYPVVIADTADNAGGGAASDSTFLLRELLERGITKALIGAIWDIETVKAAFAAGLGNTLAVAIGGKASAQSGQPVVATARVLNLKRDAWQTFGEGSSRMGDVAVLDVDGVTVLVNTVRTQVYHPDAFTNQGVALGDAAVVIVKSTQHFRSGFEAVAGEILYCAGPGALSPDPLQIDYEKIDRRKWPFETNPW